MSTMIQKIRWDIFRKHGIMVNPLVGIYPPPATPSVLVFDGLYYAWLHFVDGYAKIQYQSDTEDFSFVYFSPTLKAYPVVDHLLNDAKVLKEYHDYQTRCCGKHSSSTTLDYFVLGKPSG